LGDDPKTSGPPSFVEQLQAFDFEALEIVRRRARLERAAAQEFRAAARDDFGRFQDLLLVLDGTRARHHDELVAAYCRSLHAYLLGAYGRALRAYLCLDGPDLAADELVGSRDAHSLFHTRHRFERFQAGRYIAHSHHTDHDALFAGDGVHFVTELLHPGSN